MEHEGWRSDFFERNLELVGGYWRMNYRDLDNHWLDSRWNESLSAFVEFVQAAHRCQ